MIRKPRQECQKSTGNDRSEIEKMKRVKCDARGIWISLVSKTELYAQQRRIQSTLVNKTECPARALDKFLTHRCSLDDKYASLQIFYFRLSTVYQHIKLSSIGFEISWKYSNTYHGRFLWIWLYALYETFRNFVSAVTRRDYRNYDDKIKKLFGKCIEKLQNVYYKHAASETLV